MASTDLKRRIPITRTSRLENQRRKTICKAAVQVRDRKLPDPPHARRLQHTSTCSIIHRKTEIAEFCVYNDSGQSQSQSQSQSQRQSHDSDSAHSLEALTREVHARGRTRGHVNIVQLLGVAWEKKADAAHKVQPVLVLEYAHLGSLQSLLSSSSPTAGRFLGFKQKQELGLDIARGMAHMHNLGMVWGDCKPDNVLLFPDESRVGGLKAKLSDFGACEPQPSASTTFRGMSRPWTAPSIDPGGPWGEAVKGDAASPESFPNLVVEAYWQALALATASPQWSRNL
ncbi:kinase-like domain-containing protein [Lasiosphaeris hirsuta]|uniref:Kinase-like domain-containing protein n=1 Tax=Lasiosphaeris hirsuta TaxID=260670 RepID=A0AA40BD30_9PEZI|nr:kinase-like domain-containing protein [Lasiosphaeris hirsuta]